MNQEFASWPRKPNALQDTVKPNFHGKTKWQLHSQHVETRDAGSKSVVCDLIEAVKAPSLFWEVRCLG